MPTKCYRYHEWGRIASRTELKNYYEAMREEISNHKEAAKSDSIIARIMRV